MLKVHPIDIRQNFFEIGGHSLLAVRLMVQIEQRFHKHLPLATLFQSATIEQLTTRLREPTDALRWSPVVVIQASGQKPPLFCVYPAGGNVLCYFELAQQLGREQPFYGIQAFGLEAEQRPYQVEMLFDVRSFLKCLRIGGKKSDSLPFCLFLAL